MARAKLDRFLKSAADISWDLKDLYINEGELQGDLELARVEAEQFAAEHRDRLRDLSPQELGLALEQFQKIYDRLQRAMTYAFLNWCTNSKEQGRGALLQNTRERYMLIEKQLLFFELELIRLDDEHWASLRNHPALGRFRHYLEIIRLQRDHVLSEAEEKVLSEKTVTGPEAWVRFFDEILSASDYKFQGRKITQQELLAKLYEPERETRREAALTFTRGLESRLKELTFVFNTILADKHSDDRLRDYPHWLASRNLSNQISDGAVHALIESVTGRYDLVSRFYSLKRTLLGLDELCDYDRYAPIRHANGKHTWKEASHLVVESFRSFHERVGEIAERFFEGRWIDAAVHPGKRGGAFSHPAVPEVHPYILMNFTGNLRDVQTLAHELGHGVHQYLARSQGSLQARTPLTTSETASVFGEMLVFERLMASESDLHVRLSMLIGKIDDTIATVFRQVAMNRFEDRIHNLRRTKGELSSDQFSEAWFETQNQMFGGSVRLGDHYRLWWSYIPHFIHTPGYVYAYAFGELLVLALYELYRADAARFPEKYIQLLEAGGSDWPHNLLAKFGVDLQDANFWNHGLDAIEELISQAESLAESLT